MNTANTEHSTYRYSRSTLLQRLLRGIICFQQLVIVTVLLQSHHTAHTFSTFHSTLQRYTQQQVLSCPQTNVSKVTLNSLSSAICQTLWSILMQYCDC